LGKQYGLALNSQIPTLVEPLTQYVRFVLDHTPLRLLFLQPGFQFFIILSGFLLMSLRLGNTKSWNILLPILLHSIFLFLLIVSQSFRYQYPIVLFFEAFWPILFFSTDKVTHESV
jgi:hypothetical protein